MSQHKRCRALLDALQQCIDGLAHHGAGRLSAAEACYRAVLAEFPDHARALHYLGLLLLESRRPAESARCWRKLLDADPAQLAATVNLANALREAGDASGAIAACDAALSRHPRNMAAHVTRGAALLDLGRVDEAIAAYRKAVELAPDDAIALAGLALALLRAGSPEAALAAAEKAVLGGPELAGAWFALGTVLHAGDRPGAARDAFVRTIGLARHHAPAHLALGNALADLDDTAAAERMLRLAAALAPEMSEAKTSVAVLLAAQHRLGEAVAICDDALAADPGFAPLHWARANALLLAGDLAEGFRAYEWRARDPRYTGRMDTAMGPRWQGENLDGRTLLVVAEQGLGDTIQMARYLPVLARRGARALLACDEKLTGLLGQLCPTFIRGAALPEYDFWIHQMSLPARLGTRQDTIPTAAGYLLADPAIRSQWNELLGGILPVDACRVGLAWAGNPAHRNDRRRSLPAALLDPIVAVRGYRFVSLQVGASAEDAPSTRVLRRETSVLRDFTDTAALIAALDLVVTVDTAVAHLAGALGRPVWLLLPYAPDWRWMLNRSDSPWYASMRLFRQPAPGDWESPIAAVAGALRNRIPSATEGRASVMRPAAHPRTEYGRADRSRPRDAR